jgi:hypothetical protein
MKVFNMIRLSGIAGSGISNLLHPLASLELEPEIGMVFLLPLADYTLYEILMADYGVQYKRSFWYTLAVYSLGLVVPPLVPKRYG